ncbi:hypothetical protein A6V36_25685 [Paraburkholderia ginsengiterrae]|uniref:Transmembrane protein n=1 Tax=Paraburkholderia ginsengiterrae TaxID=1462993 RepID=A0ABX2UYX3_9BURK|nr:hypothetical protein A6V36_25685 [Paraburkholderia ginsengiterrae]
MPFEFPFVSISKGSEPCGVRALLDLCWAFIFFVIRLMWLPNVALAVRPCRDTHFQRVNDNFVRIDSK